MFSTIKMAIAIMLITGIAGAGVYVMKLQCGQRHAEGQSDRTGTGHRVADQTVLEQQKQDFNGHNGEQQEAQCSW
jgi:hypothetical protein